MFYFNCFKNMFPSDFLEPFFYGYHLCTKDHILTKMCFIIFLSAYYMSDTWTNRFKPVNGSKLAEDIYRI